MSGRLNDAASGSCKMASFVIRNAEPSGYLITVSVNFPNVTKT